MNKKEKYKEEQFIESVAAWNKRNTTIKSIDDLIASKKEHISMFPNKYVYTLIAIEKIIKEETDYINKTKQFLSSEEFNYDHKARAMIYNQIFKARLHDKDLIEKLLVALDIQYLSISDIMLEPKYSKELIASF